MDSGSGLWTSRAAASSFGYVGLWPATFDAHFTPAIEVGWRVAERFWGSGLATEAAYSVIADGFDRLGLDEIVSFTSAINVRSRPQIDQQSSGREMGNDFADSIEPK